MTDLNQALRNPAAIYDSPEDVIADPELTAVDALRVLRRWQHDLEQLETADEEGLLGPPEETRSPGLQHQAVRRQITRLEEGLEPS